MSESYRIVIPDSAEEREYPPLVNLDTKPRAGEHLMFENTKYKIEEIIHNHQSEKGTKRTALVVEET